MRIASLLLSAASLSGCFLTLPAPLGLTDRPCTSDEECVDAQVCVADVCIDAVGEGEGEGDVGEGEGDVGEGEGEGEQPCGGTCTADQFCLGTGCVPRVESSLGAAVGVGGAPDTALVVDGLSTLNPVDLAAALADAVAIDNAPAFHHLRLRGLTVSTGATLIITGCDRAVVVDVEGDVIVDGVLRIDPGCGTSAAGKGRDNDASGAVGGSFGSVGETAGSGAVHGTPDLSPLEGGSDGSTNNGVAGGKGGSALAIVAQGTVSGDGRIEARGGNGSIVGSSGSGSGSGGGVLIEARAVGDVDVDVAGGDAGTADGGAGTTIDPGGEGGFGRVAIYSLTTVGLVAPTMPRGLVFVGAALDGAFVHPTSVRRGRALGTVLSTLDDDGALHLHRSTPFGTRLIGSDIDVAVGARQTAFAFHVGVSDTAPFRSLENIASDVVDVTLVGDHLLSLHGDGSILSDPGPNIGPVPTGQQFVQHSPTPRLFNADSVAEADNPALSIFDGFNNRVVATLHDDVLIAIDGDGTVVLPNGVEHLGGADFVVGLSFHFTNLATDGATLVLADEDSSACGAVSDDRIDTDDFGVGAAVVCDVVGDAPVTPCQLLCPDILDLAPAHDLKTPRRFGRAIAVGGDLVAVADDHHAAAFRVDAGGRWRLGRSEFPERSDGEVVAAAISASHIVWSSRAAVFEGGGTCSFEAPDCGVDGVCIGGNCRNINGDVVFAEVP